MAGEEDLVGNFDDGEAGPARDASGPDLLQRASLRLRFRSVICRSCCDTTPQASTFGPSSRTRLQDRCFLLAGTGPRARRRRKRHGKVIQSKLLRSRAVGTSSVVPGADSGSPTGSVHRQTRSEQRFSAGGPCLSLRAGRRLATATAASPRWMRAP